MYVSFATMFILYSSLASSNRGKERQKEPKYNNVYEQNREKPTTLLCTVDERWEFKGISGFFFVIFIPLLGRAYSRSIRSSTESIGWHSIADGINIKILYTFLHVYISGWLCKLLLWLSLCQALDLNHLIIKTRFD